MPDVVVLGSKKWHEGVLGIVASKLVEEFGRPTILFRIDEKSGIAKGSARSTEALDMYTALTDSKDLLTKFGGHKMAAGMSLPAADLSAFTEKINSYAALYHDAIVLGESIYIDAMLPLADVTLPFLKELELLKPYGTDNPKPIFGFQNVPLTDIRQIGADNKHLKFKLKDKNLFLDVIGFNKGSISNHLNEADVVSLIGELSMRRLAGQRETATAAEGYQKQACPVFRQKEFGHPRIGIGCRRCLVSIFDFRHHETIL